MKRKNFFCFWSAAALVAVIFLTGAPFCRGEETTGIKPLFAVGLEHEFPRAKETFEQVKDLILKNYYTEDITEEALYYAAVQGMLRHISPPKSPELCTIWTAREYEKILLSRKGEQVSLGLKSSFNPETGSLTISEVLPNSPAESALLPFDRILRIDDKPLKGKTPDEINELLNGEEGSGVALTVNRDVDVFKVTLTRRKFTTQSLLVSRLTDAVALAQIDSFTANTSKELSGELRNMKTLGVQKLIIDLRSNPGGVLIEALRVVELFVPEKHVLMRTYQQDTKLQNYVSTNKDPFDFGIAVLVNLKTASAAEVLAKALQDHKLALIVGTRTFGKGVFEKTFSLENDFRVKFITGAMYSPKGQSWQDTGVTPDFLVEQDDNTLSALRKLEPKDRLFKDVAMITAYKLLLR